MKEGYKQTDIGVIPEDWEVQPLCKVAEIRTGIAKNSNASVSSPILVHYLRVANVQDGFLDLADMKKIEISRMDLKHYSVMPGDILMNEGGDLDKLGRGSIWRGELDPCVHQNHVFVVRKRVAISSDYLNVWTNGDSARRYFLLAGKQTTNLATINKSALGKLPVAIPPPPEQHRIASTLSSIDAVITTLEKVIAKKQAIKTAAMQELLTGKTRLPGFGEGKGYKQTELGEIPEDWGIHRLGSLCSAIVDGTHYTPNYVASGVPFYSVENVTSNNFKNTKFISEKEHSILVKRCKPEKGDILLTRIGSLAVTKLIDWDVDASIYVSLALLKLNGLAISEYVYVYSKFRKFYEETLKRSLVNATPQKINMNDIGEIPLIIPSETKEQVDISNALSGMDTDITHLETRLAKTKAIKKGMMQELLTGRTRLV